MLRRSTDKAVPRPAVLRPSAQSFGESTNPFVILPAAVVLALRVLFGMYFTVVISACIGNNLQHGLYGIGVIIAVGMRIVVTFLPFILYRREYGLCHPLIIAASLGITNMMLRSTGLMISGLRTHVAIDASSEDINLLYIYGEVLNTAATFALYLGASLRRGSVVVIQPRRRLPRTYFLALYLGAIVGVMGTFAFAQVAGGWSGLIANLGVSSSARYYESSVRGLGQYVFVMYFSVAAALLWLAADRRAFYNPFFWPVGVLGLMVPFLQAGRRSALIFTSALYLLIWSLNARRVPYLRFGMVVVFALLFLGTVAEFRRANFSSRGTLNMDFLTELTFGGAVTKSMEELQLRSGQSASILPILAKVPKEVPLLWGQGYVSYLYLFIPRQLWPEKPRGLSVRAGAIFLGVDWGVPPGAVGEAYWNFHVLGVVTVFFLCGLAYSVIMRWYLESGGNPLSTTLFVITIFFVMPPSNEGFVSWVYIAVPSFLLAIAARIAPMGVWRRRPLQNASLGHLRTDVRPLALRAPGM